MKRTGQLDIDKGESRLDEGTLLARCAETDPIGSGTSFLENKGLRDGDPIWVTGEDGTAGGVSAFCMDDAGPNQPAAMPVEKAQGIRMAAVKVAKRPKQKKSRKRAKKQTKAKKSRSKARLPKKGKSS